MPAYILLRVWCLWAPAWLVVFNAPAPYFLLPPPFSPAGVQAPFLLPQALAALWGWGGGGGRCFHYWLVLRSKKQVRMPGSAQVCTVGGHLYV